METAERAANSAPIPAHLAPDGRTSVVSAPVLAVEAVTKRFGGLVVLDGITLHVASGAIHGVIGPNGAGKTTLFNVINGIYTASSGRIIFRDRDITNARVNRIACLGLGRTFQVARVFNEMSLIDNMLVPTIRQGRSRRDAEARALKLLELAGLSDLRHQAAIEVSGGQKKLLEFMRTMMCDPELILLDEPFAGINPALVERLTGIMLQLNLEHGRSFLLISHEMPQIMRLCETVTVLAAGKTIAHGKPAELRHHPAVIEAYLGH